MDYIFAKLSYVVNRKCEVHQFCVSLSYVFEVNKMASRTTLVFSLSLFIILSSAIINANVFDIMVVLIQDISKMPVKFQKYDTANTAMVNIEIDHKICKKVREFLLIKQSIQNQQEELYYFLKDISPRLRFKVLIHIFSTVMKFSTISLSLLSKVR